MLREILQSPSPVGRFIATNDAEMERILQPVGRLRTIFRTDPKRIQCSGKASTISDIAYSAEQIDQEHVVDVAALENYTFAFHIAGSMSWRVGRESGEISPRTSALGMPGDHAVVARGADSAMFSLRVKPAAVMDKVSSIIGEKAPRKIVFQRENSLERPEATSLIRTVSFLIKEHETLGESNARSIVLGELEQAVIVLMLFASRHDFERALERGQPNVAPWQVHRAEEYIKAHSDTPITIETLAKVTGASARSLFQTFRDSRGYSPIAFAKKMRLQRARQQLETGDGSLMVTDVALACGFGNLGHFAKDYAEAFGEKPSVTLAKAKARVSVGRLR